MNTRKFVIECEIPERWVNDFCAMLERMEYYASIGHSGIVAIYADGDGDFLPKFNIKTDYDITLATRREKYEPLTVYDAR